MTEPTYKNKYKYNDKVFFWDDENLKLVEGIVRHMYSEYLNGDFQQYTYVLSTDKNPVKEHEDEDKLWRMKNYKESDLFESKEACLDNEYKKTIEEQEQIKNREEELQEKLHALVLSKYHDYVLTKVHEIYQKVYSENKHSDV